jgi:hypothetical protein
MWFSRDFAFAEDLALCPRHDKRAFKIAMQHLSPVMPGENLFAKASASEQALPHGRPARYALWVLPKFKIIL